MKPEFFIARRFAFKARSQTRPTFIVMASVAGIAIGTAALILTLSIVGGFSSIIEGKLIRFTSHLQVRQPDDRLFPETRYDLETLRSTPGIVSASPFLEMNVMLRGRKAGAVPGAVAPAVIRGVSMEEAGRFLGSRSASAALERKDASSPLPLYLGKTLAESMGVRPGDRIMIVGLSGKGSGIRDGAPGSIVDLLSSLDLEVARVAGLYETGLNEGFDDLVAFADLGLLQQRYHPGQVSGYGANVRDPASLDAIASDAGTRMGYPFYAYTVYQRYANLFEWLKLQKNVMPLLIVSITVVAVFNIVSTLLVLIIEKTREIGMLAALGLEPGRVSVLFMSQAFMISLVGIIAGNLLALGLSLFELRFHLIALPEKSYFVKHVPIQIDPLHYLLVSGGVALLAILFAYIPSRVAASLNPGTALTV